MSVEDLIRSVTSPFVRRVVRTRIGTIEGAEHLPEGPFVLVPNHSSYFDHFVTEVLVELFTGRPVWFLTKRESFDRPVQRAWARAWHGIPVDRDAPAPDTVREVRRVLNAGDVLCVYPEGTRNATDRLLPFKHGAFRFALANDVPLVPVGLHGTRDVLRKGDRWFRDGRVDVVFGPPLRVASGMSKHAASVQLAEDARTTLEGLISRARENSARSTRPEVSTLSADLVDRLITAGLDERGNLPYSDRRRLGRLTRMLRAVEAPDAPSADLLAQAVRLEGLGLTALPGPVRALAALRYRSRVRRILDADPGHRDGHYLMGRWHLAVPGFLGGVERQAIDHFRASAAASPAGDTRALTALAEVLLASGDDHAAADTLRVVISDTPPDHPRHAVRVAKARDLLEDLERRDAVAVGA